MKKTIYLILLFIFLIMAIQNWGALQKSADDDETIEQAIDRLIAVHEGDSTAHLGDGESLQAHKNEDVIDHPAFSVLDDKMAFDRNSVDLEMNSLTPFNATGGIEINGIKTWYIYSSSSSSPQNLWGAVGDLAQSSEFAFSKNPRFLTSIAVSAITYTQGYILVGETDEGNGFGFKILNNKLYGVYFDSDNVEHTVEIQTLIANTVYKLEARVTYPSTIEFFVNNGLAGSFSSVDLDITMTVIPSIPWVDFKSTTGSSRSLYLRGFYWEADF